MKGPPSLIRGVVAQNIAALRDRKYAALSNETQRNRQLAADVGISLSQAQRIVKGSLGTSIDYIEKLAALFTVAPRDLLTPYFATSTQQGPEGDAAESAHGAAPAHAGEPRRGQLQRVRS